MSSFFELEQRAYAKGYMLSLRGEIGKGGGYFISDLQGNALVEAKNLDAVAYNLARLKDISKPLSFNDLRTPVTNFVDPAKTQAKQILLSSQLTNVNVGDVVEARFTNSGNRIVFPGRIAKVNQNTVRVASLTDGVQGWGAGHEFVIPRHSNPLSTVNNGIYPMR
jgi:phosphoglycerate-specific signal transduction histidine kinase